MIRYQDLQAGMQVEVFGFDCMDGVKIVCYDENGYYVSCHEGHHYLDAQIGDDGEELIGIMELSDIEQQLREDRLDDIEDERGDYR